MKLRFLIFVPLLLAALPSIAADDEIEHIVVTATRRAVDSSELSAAVSTVQADDLTGIKLATDALQDLVGASLQQTTPGQGAAIIRGLKGSAILHLVDGMRLNNAMFRTAPTPWFALVPAGSVERIEVVRGTPASLYGSEAVGGVVQSVSRLPEFDSDEVGYAGDVTAGFDSAELQRSLRATLDFGTKRLASSLSAEYLRTGDRKTGSGKRVGPSAYTSRALRAVVRGRPAEHRSWLLDLQFLEQPETPRVDELVAGFGQTEPASSEFLFAPNQRYFVHAQHEHLSPAGIDWKIDTAWQRIVDDRLTRDLNALQRRDENNRSDLYGLTLNASAGEDALRWIAGIDLYHDEVRSARNAKNIVDGTITRLAPRFPDGSTVSQAGIFGNVQWQFTDRQSLSGGLRYTDVRIDLPNGTDISPGRLSGDLGWIFDLSDTLQFVANAGSGFRAPNIADLGTLGNRPGNRFNIPNSNLAAEKVFHGDLGVRHRSARWQFELAVFALRYTDRIASVSTGNTTPGGRDIVQSVNAASSTIRGLEAGMDVDLTSRISVSAILNYARGQQRVGGIEEPADRVAPLNGHIALRYDTGGHWQFESWLRAADRQDRLSARDIRDARIDPNGTAGWASLGANATWSNASGWQVTLAADNLADKDYRAHGSGINAPGRSLSATVRRRW